MSRVFLIAEAGSCHDGDPGKMREMVRVAKDAGADAVKTQWTSSPERLVERRHAQDYLEAYRTIAFPASTLSWLKALCDAAEIEFMCSVFLPEDIQEIAPLVKRFKVASFEAGDDGFLAAHLDYGKPIIVSTGGTDEHGLWRLKKWWGENHEQVSLLHCVAAYPAPMEELNLHVMDELDGLSDHTQNLLTGALAAARGASIIEVHFRLDSTDPQNPDYGHSLTPSDLRAYIVNVRFAEVALGSGIKAVQPSERQMLKYRVTGNS